MSPLCRHQVWARMYDAADLINLTEQQQQLIAIGCNMYTRLIQSVMEQRHALTARQQELLELSNGRSLDLQKQQQCADRLNVLVRKERFLHLCMAAHVASVCSVVQMAQLMLLMWPHVAQMGVFAKVVAKKVQEREQERELQRQQKLQQRRLRQLMPAAAAAVAAAISVGGRSSPAAIPSAGAAAAAMAAAAAAGSRPSAHVVSMEF